MDQVPFFDIFPPSQPCFAHITPIKGVLKVSFGKFGSEIFTFQGLSSNWGSTESGELQMGPPSLCSGCVKAEVGKAAPGGHAASSAVPAR